MSSGVLIRRSRGSASRKVSTVITAPSRTHSQVPFQKYRLNSAGSFAPVDWARGMPKPTQAPWTKPRVRKFSE